MLEIREVLKQLTNEHIIEIMLELGFEYPSNSSNGEMIFNSLCHGDTSKRKLYCYPNEDSHTFYCYICLFKGNICDLIMHVKQTTFDEAFKIIKRVGGFTSRVEVKQGFGSIPIISDDYWKLLSACKTHKKINPILPNYSENVLNLFSKEYHISWINDHISIEAMQKYDIGYYLPHNAITIPHRDIYGNLIGIRKRNLDEETVSNGFKYMPIKIEQTEYKHPLAFNMFGIYENQDNIKRLKKACIFESEKSVLQIESYYGSNNWSLAMCGSTLSNTQRDLILSLGVEEVILCVDKDWETKEDVKYKIFKKKYMKIAQKLAPFVNFYVVEKGMEKELGLKESPSDRGREVFEILLKQKKLITLDMVQTYIKEEKQ